MKINRNAMAIIILCSHLCVGEEVSPLAANEWSNLAALLVKQQMQPYQLLESNSKELMKKLGFTDELIQRIEALISRSASLTFTLEKLFAMGIRIVTRADKEYPVLLRRVLRNSCPPLFYYAGDIQLVNTKLVGFISDKTINDVDIHFTKTITETAIDKGYGIVSSDVQGTDALVTETTITKGGYIISYTSDSLTKRIKDTFTIKSIRDGKLVLLSTATPDTGIAMSGEIDSNIYVYASAVGTVIVKSEDPLSERWTNIVTKLNNTYLNLYCWNNTLYKRNIEWINRGVIPIDEHWDVNITFGAKK